MQLVLKTYYRREFLPLIVSFVTETARCLGANAKEISELGLAADEAGLHIIEHYPGDGMDWSAQDISTLAVFTGLSGALILGSSLPSRRSLS